MKSERDGENSGKNWTEMALCVNILDQSEWTTDFKPITAGFSNMEDNVLNGGSFLKKDFSEFEVGMQVGGLQTRGHFDRKIIHFILFLDSK